jgi:hypothetical protein
MAALSGWVSYLVETQFRKDQNGRVVFLPGMTGTGYYVDNASEIEKIKSPMAVYTAAVIFVELLGSLCCIAIMMAIAFSDPSVPVGHRIRVGLAVYLIVSLPFMIFPRWLLGKLYREMIPGICSSLSAATAESIEGARRNLVSSRRRMLLLVGLTLLMIAIVLIVLVGPHSPR